MQPIKRADVYALFTLADIPVLRVWGLAHSYFTYQEGEDPEITQRNALYRAQRPSWLVKTPHGMIELNLRKRVVEIDWSDTPYRARDVGAGHPITTDDVTKEEKFVHAYDLISAASYLRKLGEGLRQAEAPLDLQPKKQAAAAQTGTLP